jgi:hypothetical protein
MRRTRSQRGADVDEPNVYDNGCDVGKHHSRRRRTTGNAKSAHREVD